MKGMGMMCPFCYQLTTEEQYMNHLWDCKVHSTYIKEILYGYECKLCSGQSADYSMMIRHMKQDHSKQILVNWTSVRNGLKYFHREEKINGVRKYFCKFCHQEKSKNVEMLFHLKELHTDVIQELTSNPHDTKNQAILKDLEPQKSQQKSKKIKRKFATEVGLLRRLQERSYMQAKQAAEMAQELKNEEKGDINRKTDVNVVTSIKSNQMIFEIEEKNEIDTTDVKNENDTTDVDTDVEMIEEPKEKDADVSVERMLADFFSKLRLK